MARLPVRAVARVAVVSGHKKDTVAANKAAQGLDGPGTGGDEVERLDVAAFGLQEGLRAVGARGERRRRLVGSLTKLLPVAGTLVSVPVAYGVTWAIGQAALAHFAAGGTAEGAAEAIRQQLKSPTESTAE
jgi:hypothetical protein